MGARLQDSAYRKHTVKEAIQAVQEVIKDLGFMMPLEALAHLAAGYDPRKGNPVRAYLKRLDKKKGYPEELHLTKSETARLRAMLDVMPNFDDVPLDVSQRAIERLADFIYPKQKMIESTNLSGVLIEAPAKVTKKAVKALMGKLEEDY